MKHRGWLGLHTSIWKVASTHVVVDAYTNIYAPLLPLFCFEDPPGQPRLVVEAPVVIESGPARDRAIEAALRHYTSLLEGYVRRYPAQYRNWHFLGDPAAA